MKNGQLNFGFDRYSLLYIWALFIVVFGVWKPDLFLTTGTLHSIAASQAIVVMLGIAVLIPLACGQFDLSVGATMNLTAITVAVLQTTHGFGMWTSILIALLVGVLVGAVNAFFIVVMGISSFIATLATATILGAVQAIVANQTQPMPPSSKAWTALAQREVFGFQIVVLYMLVLAVVIWWLMRHTPAGRYLYAIGGNVEASRLSGVRVGKWTALSFILAGGISGLAGVLYCSLNGPSLTFGAGLLLPAYAAAFLGSTQIRPGQFNVWGTVIAVYVLATGVRGLQLVTTAQWLNDMFNGTALVAAVGFAVWRQKSTARRAAMPGSTVRPNVDDDSSGPLVAVGAKAVSESAPPNGRQTERANAERGQL